MLSFFALGWLLAGVLVGWAGEQRGRSGFLWFVASLFFSPLLALLALIATPSLYSFQPDGIYKGVPFIKRRSGPVIALIDGTRVQFSAVENMQKAVDGETI